MSWRRYETEAEILTRSVALGYTVATVEIPTIYFDENSITKSLLILIAYLVVGAAAVIVVRRRRSAAPTATEAEAEAAAAATVVV